MKILQISSARSMGGGERHLADLVRGLARRGHDLFVAHRPGSPLGEEISSFVPTENIIKIPLRNSLDLRSALALTRFARERSVDLIHAHLARDYSLAAYASRRARTPRLVLTRHVLFPLGRIHKLLLKDASRVIAVSGTVARSLRASRVFDEDLIRVVHNGVDVERYERAAAAATIERESIRRSLGVRSRFLIGTVGELSAVKGQEDFVRAASIVARGNEETEFLIVGEDASRAGETRARIERLIVELGLEERVHLLGRRADVAEILASLDLFVSSSRSEAFGLAIAEASAAGAPVVATASGGAQEIIEDEETGRIVPVGDVEAMASVVLEMLEDEAQRARIIESARLRVRERWGLERMVEETEAVYFEALGRREE